MKKFLFTLAILVSFALASTVYAQTMVQSGEYRIDQSTPGYSLDKNSGDRSVSIEVRFKKPFDTIPEVMLSVTRLDADSGPTIRYNVVPLSVSRDGFTIKVSTWGDSKVFGVYGYWMAHTN